MKYTSSEASKFLKKLTEEYNALIEQESQRKDFLASLGEDVESVRPSYDYTETQAELEKLEGEIRTVKHAINLFNVTHTVPGFDMTVDQMLVYLPQLSAKKQKLLVMKRQLPKARENAAMYGHTSSIVDYRYTNYDSDEVARDYEITADMLAKAQVALDLINNSETMEIDL